MSSELDATATRIHEALRSVPASSTTHRALHAKGIVAEGRFTPTGELAGHTTARHLVEGSTPALVRFSHPGADPEIADAVPSARGMAVKLRTPAGSHDLVAVSSPAFLVRDGASFLELLAARAPDPATGEADPARMLAFVEAHPESLPAVQAAMGAGVPVSYATLVTNGLHAFFLVDTEGAPRPFRYSWVPVGGEQFLADPPGTVDLAAELAERLEGPPEDAAFDLVVRLGTPDDPTGDPTAVWPERPSVAAGRLQLDAVVPDPEPVIFDPTNVVDGVALDPDDEILRLRRSVYGLSYRARTTA
jgi:catalase